MQWTYCSIYRTGTIARGNKNRHWNIRWFQSRVKGGSYNTSLQRVNLAVPARLPTTPSIDATLLSLATCSCLIDSEVTLSDLWHFDLWPQVTQQGWLSADDTLDQSWVRTACNRHSKPPFVSAVDTPCSYQRPDWHKSVISDGWSNIITKNYNITDSNSVHVHICVQFLTYTAVSTTTLICRYWTRSPQ